MQNTRAAVSYIAIACIICVAYFMFREKPLDAVNEAVFVRSSDIQNDLVRVCTITINGLDFVKSKYILTTNSDIHIQGNVEFNPSRIEHPGFVSGFLMIGYRPKGVAESAWRLGGSDKEWVTGMHAGRIDQKVTISTPPGEYELRAYVLMNIIGLETPKVEYVLKSEALIAEEE